MSVEVFQSSGRATRGGTPSAGRRRLSGRVALTPLGVNARSNNDRAEKMSRRRREARRRSGRFTPVAMGPGARSKQMITHEDISNQVTETIKMHVENKINEKNAFSLPLNGMLQSTNTKFQRAGMILEAGTMIYGKRVDSTMVESLKVRESLLRTKTAEADQPKGAIKTNVSKKVCVTSTIERNLANITETKRNQAFAVDPLFRQMSQKFDKGGAQGMLLHSLPVKQGCFVAFDSSQALFAEPASDESQTDQVDANPVNTCRVLPTSMFKTLQQAIARVQNLPMCSALLDVLYNEAAAEEPFKQAGNAPTVASTASVESQLAGHQFEAAASEWNGGDTNNVGDYDDDFGEDDYDGGDDDDYMQQLAAPCQEGDFATSASSAFDFWSGDNATSKYHGQTKAMDIEVAIRESGLSDYTFFDAKFNRRAAGNGNKASSSASGSGDKKAKKSKKAKLVFDFMAAVRTAAAAQEGEIVHVFAPPAKPARMLLPQNRPSRAEDFVLPEQPHLKLQEMTKLFLNSKMSLACKIVARADDVLGGDNFDGGDYDDDGGFDDGDYGDDDVGIVDDRVGFEASANNGTERTSCMAGYADLIDAEPQVENIELAYATIAKRVDVRMLKKNLWQHVEPLKAKPSSVESSEPEGNAQGDKEMESESESSPTTEATMSFKDTMLAVKDTVPNNVSVSYFFICMLHLANEKVRSGVQFPAV
eukprot:INCI6272.1.p1 GENE.INCI6272.1~~INCI6272.1.p1  ORF type:complete len:705 (-),score=193.39 INCI6272.1:1263-3377(-)